MLLYLWNREQTPVLNNTAQDRRRIKCVLVIYYEARYTYFGMCIWNGKRRREWKREREKNERKEIIRIYV